MNLTSLRKQVEDAVAARKTPDAVLCFTQLKDNLWSVSGGFGMFPNRCTDAELEQYRQAEGIKTLVIYTVIGDSNGREC